MCKSPGRVFKLLGLCIPVILAAIVFFNLSAVFSLAATPAPVLAPLDLTDYKITFDDNFKQLDISSRGPGTRWIAHTPWYGDFGAARFGDPATDHPFSLTADGMAITARQNADGKWVSGLICSRDADGPNATGFAQEYGYFEMRAKLPDGPGIWPAFWLVGVNKSNGSSELDVMEYYGQFNNGYRSTEHVWATGPNKLGASAVESVPPGLLTQQFNDYGVMITPTTITYYFNRKPYWATATPPDYRQPFYILADLALGGGWPIKNLKSPAVMDIAYIKVYARK